ncbi:MAG: DMT family transporter [Polaromonas sp.]|nr:DMT family transporter [Polaromonas sp.]
MTDDLAGYLLAGGALVMFTSAILLTKAASSRLTLDLGFLVSVVTNILFAGLVFAVVFAVRDSGLSWHTRAFWLFVAAGVFSTYLGRFFFYESVVRFGPAKASVFQVSSPLFTGLLAWLVLGEKITLLVAGGMLLTITGLAAVSYKPGAPAASPAAAAPPPTPRGPLQYLLGSMLLLGLASSLAYATGNLMRGAAIRVWNEAALGAFIGAVTGLLLHLLLTQGRATIVARLRAGNRAGIRLYALIGVANISGQMLTIAAMRFIPLSIATLITLCTPLLVFPLSRMIYGARDDMGLLTWLGALLALAGIVVIVLR